MPAKKAAKKAAKKMSGRDRDKHDKKHGEGKDLRRAYEHLGRVSVLEKALPPGVAGQVRSLTRMAQKCLEENDPKCAADLLRAGEHLGFGSLGSTARATRLSEDLEEAIRAEFEHLTEKAEDRWEKHEEERPKEIEEVYEFLRAAANAAFAKQAYRRALEFARGAEALAHVRRRGWSEIENGGAKRSKKRALADGRV